MVESFLKLPFWMQVLSAFLVTLLIGGIAYRLIRYGIKIKAGVVEIDASEENDKPEVKA